MTALDELLKKKYRSLTASVDTVTTDVHAVLGDNRPTGAFETLVAAVEGTPLPMKEETSIATDQRIDVRGMDEKKVEEVPAPAVESLKISDPVVEPFAQTPDEDIEKDTDEDLVLAPIEVPSEMSSSEKAASKHEPAADPVPAIAGKLQVQPEEFKADWEIDRFPWPGICGEVEERVEAELVEALQQIKTACLARDSNTIVVTSAHSGVGRTTMTLCLAREAARDGMKVAIVDLDHDDPSMLTCMGIDFDKGLESLHDDDVTMRDISVVAVEDGVTLVPTVHPFNPTQSTSEEMQELLRSLSHHHDLVLIDASREVADIIAEDETCPALGVIMVKDPSSHEATEAFLEWMREKNAWTLGVIENFAA